MSPYAARKLPSSDEAPAPRRSLHSTGVQEVAFTSVTEKFRAQVLRNATLCLLFAIGIVSLLRTILAPFPAVHLAIICFCAALLAVAVGIIGKGKVQLARWLFWSGTVLLVVSAGILNGGVLAPAMTVVIVLPAIAVTLYGPRRGSVGLMVSLALIAAILLLQSFGLVAPAQTEDMESQSRTLAVTYSALALFSYLNGRLYEIARKKTHDRVNELSRLSDLGLIAAGIAHEVNNPLAAIMNATELQAKLLKSRTANEDALKRVNAHIRENSERIATITRLLGHYSSNELLKIEHTFRLAPFVSDVLERMRFMTENSGIRAVSKVPDSLEVRTHPGELQEVLGCLLSNSMDALKDFPGEKWIEIRTKKNPDSIELQVVDSGPGLRPEVVKVVFSPFFTTKSPGKGFGLSLSICSKIVSRRGGHLSYDENARNTTFVIELPR